MKKETTYTRGFASIIIVVAILATIAIVYLVIAGSQSTLTQSLSNLYAKPTLMPSVSPTPPQELDEELDAIDDSDPSSDFGDVDSDILTL